ncbi:acyltransferase family protein [Roseomonas sp. CCTCC AB2023176]|uniref:acyltransferase family protein n=1 Tax=Roseomonas sp. CCTCC AB2023176 TaxID=3342640 RepID=UPI0035D6F766
MTSPAHRNGFDAVRIVAATMVIYGHAFPLTGNVGPGFLGNSIATIGVKIFFVTSGFLITRSWLSDPDPVRFVLRRGLRIMPGLIGAILFTILILGPAFTALGLAEYAAHSGTALYLWNILLFPIYYLPGVFTQNVYPGAVNGSLWSLPPEVLMYLLTPFLLGRREQSGRVALPVFCLLLGTLAISLVRVLPTPSQAVVYGTGVTSLLDVAVYFQIGAVCALFGWERFARPLLSLAMLGLSAWWVVQNAVLTELVLFLVLPFAVISVGQQRLAFLSPILRRNDVSYGLYLYGFPVQQALIALTGNQMTPMANLAAALPVTLVLAVLSWRLIERRALSWKPQRRPSP